MLDFMGSDSDLRVAMCLPKVIDFGSIKSLYGVLPNLSDQEVDTNELYASYDKIIRIFIQLKDHRLNLFLDYRS